MRRVSGFVLTLLGAFLLLLAVLLRFWVVPDNVKIPLNQYEITTFTGTGSYFSATQGVEVNGASVRVTTTAKGDVLAGTGSTAVYDDFSATEDVTNHAPISYFGFREALDRKTAQTVRCCGEYLTNLNTGKRDYSVRMSGIGITFPPSGVQKQTYTIFDVTVGRPEPARYAGTATVDGIGVYRFVEKVAPTRFSSEQIPGSIAGIPSQPEVTLGSTTPRTTRTTWTRRPGRR
jgi:hypothetical protein